MKIFVTGGSGFVGSALVRRLLVEGHQVLALARSGSSIQRVRAAGAEPVPGDLAELGRDDSPAPEWLARLRETDAVVHVAAHMEFWGPDALFERANQVPTVALHAAAVAAGVRRFVLVSAASVSTGSQRRPVVDESTPEGRPNIAYSRVKLATERALLRAPAGNTELVVLRPPFIWGPGMAALEDMAEAVAAGRFAWIDRGTHTIDFVHVENLVGAVVRALTQGRHQGIYYVTDGTPMSVRDFLTPLLATRGADLSSIRSVPLAVAAPMAAVMDRTARLLRRSSAPPLTNWLVSFAGRDRSYDITAARTELGYEPGTTLEKGLAEMAGA
ncbi:MULTISPECIES: NAD-dependent epimerase/dehydratase family protein [Streptomyces]|uniref:NAD-dependent epimerase/dehydratase family protein n=1 Tax=Streptomyces TaxID=1883 RepID=UPI00178467DA|nr:MULTISPECIES: NAD(P)-dependent oxidoreductase [Streptomyces]MCF0088193.1 3 beta-hydroxysteroid dehydrogenase/Delta 5-->4-isomerase [Streptomyces sp. MH192]MCF0099081.1 3 beta-hydroxysteroid dehydrogenase/Delta 5-->4-isomerase [Streptomyces sp. MH191]GHE68131.1 3-beta hydroxysteroid dehydrogenase [Streptomyces griseoaurantiacus]